MEMEKLVLRLRRQGQNDPAALIFIKKTVTNGYGEVLVMAGKGPI
jgi:hypothetical protein